MIFEDCFQSCPSLRLQDLTSSDIRTYVQDTLDELDGDFQLIKNDELADIVNEITAKASGMFLWASLVGNDLRRGLANGDSLLDLRQRLSTLPVDINDLYERILRSIKRRYLSDAARLLRITYTASLTNRVLNLEELFVAVQYAHDPRPLSGTGGVWENQPRRYRELTERRLKSRCMGLLEVQLEDSATSAIPKSVSQRVHFLHQSVCEFLSQSNVHSILDRHLPEGFNPYECLLASSIAMIKTRPPGAGLYDDETQQLAYQAFVYAGKVEEETNETSSELLEEFHRAVNDLVSGDLSLRTQSA